MSYIIAISAISGGGKTTLVNACADFFKAEKLFFDDFFTKEYYPQDMRKWLDTGADLNLWTCPPLVEAIRKTKKKGNKSVTFLEEPTGKCRQEVAALIDYLIVIDTPPEIALARRINRDIQNIPHDKLADFPKDDLVKGFSELIGFYKGYFRDYETSGREMYTNIQRQVLEEADLILSWQDSVDRQLKKIQTFLESKEILKQR